MRNASNEAFSLTNQPNLTLGIFKTLSAQKVGSTPLPFQ
jgi:hypothetical protein